MGTNGVSGPGASGDSSSGTPHWDPFTWGASIGASGRRLRWATRRKDVSSGVAVCLRGQGLLAEKERNADDWSGDRWLVR